MLVLYILAVLNVFIVANRLVCKRPRKITRTWIVLGIMYGLLSLYTIESGFSLITGSIIVFGPVVLWLIRLILFGSYNK